MKAFIADMQAKLTASENARVASEQALAKEQEAHDATRKQVEAAQNATELTTLEIEKLEIQLARLRRMKFGQSSERLVLLADQLELTLEDMEAAAAHAHCVVGNVVPPEPAATSRRKALRRKLATVAIVIDLEQSARARNVSGQLGGRTTGSTERVVTIGDDRFAASVDGYEGGMLVNLANDEEPLDLVGNWRPGQRVFTARIDGDALTVKVARVLGGWKLTARGQAHVVRVLPPHVAALTRRLIEKVPPDLSRVLLAPMPGLLVRLDVGAGDRVEAGQPLAVVEAMKMENILRAGKTGVVKAIEAKAGESLAVDQVILELE